MRIGAKKKSGGILHEKWRTRGKNETKIKKLWSKKGKNWLQLLKIWIQYGIMLVDL